MDTGDRLGLPVKKDGAMLDDNNYTELVKKISEKIYIDKQTGTKRPQEPLKKVKIGKAASWVVKNAKEIGLNIEGYEHEITNYFIRHVLKNHGDAKKEVSRGNLPITGEDIEQIPLIIESPDYTIFGAKRNNENRVIYAKNLKDGTMLYFEEILSGKNNKSLRGNTLYKTQKILNEKGVIANIGMNGKTDLSNIKIWVFTSRRYHCFEMIF